MICCGRRILIKPESEKTIIKTVDSSLVERGKVLAVGDDCKFVNVGDTILFNSFGCDKVKVGDEEHYFVIETDEFILAKIPLCGDVVA